MRCTIMITVLLLLAQNSFAQQAVQQPVVGTTSVSTTVSVPDRGRVFLGGVSSAESGRSQYGPLRSGPSTGYAVQASSMSVSVYVHDLQAIDEALLNSTPSSVETIRPKIDLAATIAARDKSQPPSVSPAEKAVRYELLARKADESGRVAVAKLHWQMAAKYGSKSAEVRLAELQK